MCYAPLHAWIMSCSRITWSPQTSSPDCPSRTQACPWGQQRGRQGCSCGEMSQTSSLFPAISCSASRATPSSPSWPVCRLGRSVPPASLLLSCPRKIRGRGTTMKTTMTMIMMKTIFLTWCWPTSRTKWPFWVNQAVPNDEHDDDPDASRWWPWWWPCWGPWGQPIWSLAIFCSNLSVLGLPAAALRHV